jgi:hypothetical protein
MRRNIFLKFKVNKEVIVKNNIFKGEKNQCSRGDNSKNIASRVMNLVTMSHMMWLMVRNVYLKF